MPRKVVGSIQVYVGPLVDIFPAGFLTFGVSMISTAAARQKVQFYQCVAPASALFLTIIHKSFCDNGLNLGIFFARPAFRVAWRGRYPMNHSRGRLCYKNVEQPPSVVDAACRPDRDPVFELYAARR